MLHHPDHPWLLLPHAPGPLPRASHLSIEETAEVLGVPLEAVEVLGELGGLPIVETADGDLAVPTRSLKRFIAGLRPIVVESSPGPAETAPAAEASEASAGPVVAPAADEGPALFEASCPGCQRTLAFVEGTTRLRCPGCGQHLMVQDAATGENPGPGATAARFIRNLTEFVRTGRLADKEHSQ
jgi:DNA-directed RNA polymerase subunit RPC12/RpoP